MLSSFNDGNLFLGACSRLNYGNRDRDHLGANERRVRRRRCGVRVPSTGAMQPAVPTTLGLVSRTYGAFGITKYRRRYIPASPIRGCEALGFNLGLTCDTNTGNREGEGAASSILGFVSMYE